MTHRFHWFTVFLPLLLIATLFMNTPAPVEAQFPNCYWKLVSEEPMVITVSSASDAVGDINGTTVTVQWRGLSTTHTWTYPGATLTPGDTLVIEVGASWDVEGGSSAGDTIGGLATSFYFPDTHVSIQQTQIVFKTNPSDSIANSASFTIPYGSKEGATLSIYGFADAAVGGGRVDYKYVYFCPTATPTPTETETPTPSSTATETGTPTFTATTCPALTEQEKYEAIIDRFLESDISLPGNSGMKLNIFSWFDNVFDPYVCGSYQASVLRMLDKLKFSENPCERALLDKWDYGPIEAWWGYHQAVVLYPWATNWMETGTVLDPWIEQKPQIYEIKNWAIYFSGHAFAPFIESQYTEEERSGASFRGIGPSGVYSKPGNYPIFGGDYTAAGYEIDLSPEENAFIKTLPEDKKNIFRRMSKKTQKEYLEMKLAGVEKANRVVADCPLKLYVVNAAGERSGISGDTVYDQLPDVSFMSLPLEDGTIVTDMTYPQGAGYTLVLESSGEGKAEVLIGETLTLEEETGGLQHYSFDVEESVVYQVSTDRLGAPLLWNGGSLEPETMTKLSEEWLNSLPDLEFPPAIGFSAAVSSGEGSLFNRFASWRPVLPGVIFLFVVGAAGLLVFAVLLIMKLAKRKKLPAAPQHNAPAVQWILLAGLFAISSEFAFMGGVGLLNNLRQPASDDQFTETISTPAAYLVVTATSPLVTEIAAATTQPAPVDATATITPQPLQPAATGVAQPREPFRNETGFFDDFSAKTFGWPEMDDGRKILKYEDGGYSFQLLEKDGFDVVPLPVEFNPQEIAFDVKGVEGMDDGTFGVFCQFQDQSNYYYVEFDLLDGTYVIAQSLDGEYKPLTVSTEDGKYWLNAQALKPSSEVNHIDISCGLEGVLVRANDQPVDIVFVEKPFTGTGSASLLVFTYGFAGDDGYKVIFDNVEAYPATP